MIDQSPLPSRQLQLFASIARWSLRLLLAFWLLVAAVWGTLHGFIVPRISEWRPEIEQMVTQALGAQVSIEKIYGQTDGLLPTIHMQGISVAAPGSQHTLQIHTIIATISARSVLRLGLEQLYIEAPRIHILRHANGTWQIAGLAQAQATSSDSQALRWVLEQPELLIRKGTLVVSDEQSSGSAVALDELAITLRNHGWRHEMRLEALPELAQTRPVQITGIFRDALLPNTQAPWHQWTGQWYTDFHLPDLPHFALPASWGIDAINIQGHTRAWLDIRHGKLDSVTADVALPITQVQWRTQDISALDIRQVHGRVHAVQQGTSWHVQGKDVSFRQRDGALWPSSNWSMHVRKSAQRLQSVSLQLDYADLALAARIANHLPLPAPALQQLSQWAPQGEAHQLDMHWDRNGDYHLNGEISHLVLAPQPSQQGTGIPGVDGMHARFAFNQNGGQAWLHMQDGTLHFPGVFEEPALPLQALDAQLHWRYHNERLRLEVAQATFSNADAHGTLHGWWQMGENAQDRLPGELHLTGKLQRANGARVHRYLPVQIPQIARHYVRDSVLQGQGENVEFEVRGMLKDMPFDQPGTGRFYIKAPVKNVTYAFVPPSLMERQDTSVWPTLTSLKGNLIFEGSSLHVQQAQSSFESHPKLHMAAISAHIPDMKHPVLKVNALGHMPMDSTLELVRNSPLAHYTDHVLDTAQAQGNATIGFELELPIDHLQKSKVQGNVVFQGTALQFGPETPWLQQLHGAVRFSETGFTLQEIHGQALGGALQITGGMSSPQAGVHIKAHGNATAQGLRQERALPFLPELALHAEGSAHYFVDIKAHENTQQISVRSDLRKMALQLPAPFDKPQDAIWPLAVTQSTSADHIRTFNVSIPERIDLTYVYPTAQTAEDTVRGHIGIGKSTQDTNAMGHDISADIRLEEFNVDAWLAVLAMHHLPSESSQDSAAFLPNRIQLNTQSLVIKDRSLTNVKAYLQEAHGTWRGQVSAKQFGGYVEYRTPQLPQDSGLLYARLSHLSIPPTEVQRLNAPAQSDTDTAPSTLPALDIEVEQLEIENKQLGKLQLQARNSAGLYGRDWTLEQFNLSNANASWKANGSWVTPAHGAPRKTQLSFLLDIESSGRLLEQFGMFGTIRDGKGRLSGEVAWSGSPISPNWHSMDGFLHMQIEKGQFLKVEPGIGKLLSVLSLQSLSRRVVLDFRDVFSQGFAFDFIRGDITVEQGLAHTNNLQMRGLNAAVLMEGYASLVHETQDLTVVVIPEINAMSASLAATAINPVIGLGSFVAQMFLRAPLMEAATRSFHIGGTWADAVVQPLQRLPKTPSLD